MSYNILVDVDESDNLAIATDAQTELDFQNFMLSAAEDDLISGTISHDKKPYPGLERPVEIASTSQAIGDSSSRTSPEVKIVQENTTTQSSMFWTLEYWKFYFQTTTSQLIERISATLISPQTFATLTPIPDLYGTFWIPTTLILVLFVSNTIIHSTNVPGYVYDITVLSIAAAFVGGYIFAASAIVWGVAKWAGQQGYICLDYLCVFAYGVSIWIPVSVSNIFGLQLRTSWFCKSTTSQRKNSMHYGITGQFANLLTTLLFFLISANMHHPITDSALGDLCICICFNM